MSGLGAVWVSLCGNLLDWCNLYPGCDSGNRTTGSVGLNNNNRLDGWGTLKGLRALSFYPATFDYSNNSLYNMSMDTEDILFDVIIYGKCSCGAVGTEDHTCPYADELHGDTSTCNCCDNCTKNCADDI